MSNRIDDYLDGTLDGDQLTRRERDDADAAREAIDRYRAFLARKPAPDLTADVMGRIAALECRPDPAVQNWWRRLVAGCWAPRQVAIRPMYALLTVAAGAALVWFMVANNVSHPSSARLESPQVFVQFRLNTLEATRVQLAGSFTRWQPVYDLRQTSPGIWTAIVPLAEGVHDYSFIVDGDQWVVDPYSPHVSDGFGGANSRMTLLLAEGPRS